MEDILVLVTCDRQATPHVVNAHNTKAPYPHNLNTSCENPKKVTSV